MGPNAVTPPSATAEDDLGARGIDALPELPDGRR